MSDAYRRDPVDPRYRDPMQDSQMGAPPTTPLVEERSNSALWGLLAVAAIIIVGGIVYMNGTYQVTSTAPKAPISTTGNAPSPESRPLPTPTPTPRPTPAQ